MQERVPTNDELLKLIRPLWLATQPSKEAQAIRAALSVAVDDGSYRQWVLDYVPDYVWDLVDIAAQKGINIAKVAD